MAVNRPPMASWLDSGVALLTLVFFGHLKVASAYEEHRPKIKGAFVPGSRLVRAQFVLPNRFVFFRRSLALESCSACENPHVLRGGVALVLRLLAKYEEHRTNKESLTL